MDKSQLRIKAKEIRKTLDIKKISHAICLKIKNMDEYKNSQNIMIFYPMKYEINLLELLEDDKNFYLPKVSKTDIFVCPYSTDLKKTELNIYEPCTDPVNPEILDLIIVPALMVDKSGFRLGYGGGFYDRFLSKYQNIKTIVPIEKELLVEKIPHDKFDVKIDKIIKN